MEKTEIGKKMDEEKSKKDERKEAEGEVESKAKEEKMSREFTRVRRRGQGMSTMEKRRRIKK